MQNIIQSALPALNSQIDDKIALTNNQINSSIAAYTQSVVHMINTTLNDIIKATEYKNNTHNQIHELKSDVEF